MTRRDDAAAGDSEEVKRVSGQMAGRLAARGVRLTGRERPEELVQIEDAIERFEAAVEARGGDLMMDEGPPGRTPQPDDPHFALPLRREHQSVAQYLERLARTTDDIWRHPPRAQ